MAKIKTEKTISDKKLLKEWYDFADKTLVNTEFRNFVLFGSYLYSIPDGTPDLTGVKVLRAGLQLGEVKKNRFEPSHSLAMYLKKEQVKVCEDLNLADERVEKYLLGEEIPTENDTRGYRLVCVDGYSTGWGKCDGNMIKNHYPKGLRIMK